VDAADGGDAVVLDQHIFGVGVGSGGVENADAAEQGLGGRDRHSGLLVEDSSAECAAV
jgi:hypothetical protein